jgi:hypothetical protein
VFRAVAFSLFKLGEVLDQLLHVFNRCEFGSRLLLLEVGLDMALDFLRYLAVILEHDFVEELVVVLADYNLGFFKLIIK